jgi:hypothetical protein
MLQSLVAVLHGPAAAQVKSCNQARGDLLKKLEAMERRLGGDAITSNRVQ